MALTHLEFKPFLLHALVGWCRTAGLTPTLSVDGSDIDLVLPEGVARRPNMAFNLAGNAAMNLQIGSEVGVAFTGFFKECEGPRNVVLPISCWRGVFVRETGQTIRLDEIRMDMPEVKSDVPVEKPRPGLRLVWDRDAAQGVGPGVAQDGEDQGAAHGSEDPN